MNLTAPKMRQRGIIDPTFVLPLEERSGRLVYPVKRNPKSRDQTPCYVTIGESGYAEFGTCPDWIYASPRDGFPCKHMEVVDEVLLTRKRKAYLAAWNLPTYPIYNHMLIGERSLNELEWLLDRGTIQDERTPEAFYLLSRENSLYTLGHVHIQQQRQQMPTHIIHTDEYLRDLLYWCRRDRTMRPIIALLPAWHWYAHNRERTSE